jgi:hypothetical protein
MMKKVWLKKMSSFVDVVKKDGQELSKVLDQSSKALMHSAKIEGKELSKVLEQKSKTLINTAKIEGKELSKVFDEKVAVLADISTDKKKSLKNFVDRYQKTDKKHSELSEEEKIKLSIAALNGKDRIGLFGEAGGALLGGIAGAGTAGTIASAAGASTLMGSSALGSALGSVFVAATPVGWVVGSALVLGAAGYGAAKLVRSGSEQDKIRAELIEQLQNRLKTEKESPKDLQDIEELRQLSAVCIAGGVLKESNLERMLTLIEQEKMDINIAKNRLKQLAIDNLLIET